MDLAALGIDDALERAYRDLVTSGPARPSELASRVGVRIEEAARLLGALADAGLAAVDTSQRASRYTAAPPEVALRALLVRRRDELGRAEAALAELAELFRASAAGRSVRDLIEVVTGVTAVRQRFAQIQNGATRDVRVFVRAGATIVTAADNDTEPAAVKRGVQFRVVLERDVLAEPGGWAAAESALADGELLRVVPTLPMRLMIADGQVGLVPLSASGEPGAVVVRASGLLDALVALFELQWTLGADLRRELLTGADPTARLDGRITTLLLQGLTDRAIAKQLDVSARTVQRRIRSMMDAAGVGTRMQLGYRLGVDGGTARVNAPVES